MGYDLSKALLWELELDALESNDLQEILDIKRQKPIHQFSKFISSNYKDLVGGNSPLVMSHQMIEHLVLNKMPKTKQLFCCDRQSSYDQWRVLQTHLSPFYKLQEERFAVVFYLRQPSMLEMHYLLGSYRFTSNDCTQTFGKMISIREEKPARARVIGCTVC